LTLLEESSVRRKWATFAFIALIIFAFAEIGASAEITSLRISGWKLPFNVPIMIELDRESYNKAFPDFGVSVVNMQTGPQLMAALAAGEIDIVQGIGDAAFLVSVAGGVDARIIAAASRSPKAFAVVARSGIENVSDLRGKRVAGLRGSVVHQVMVSALSEAGMTEADIEFFPMPVAQAGATLLAGRVDAALLVGGEILRAAKAGARVLADGDGRVDGLSLVVASSRFISEHPDTVRAFLEMRAGTLAFMKRNPEVAAVTAAVDSRLDLAEVESMMEWYDFDSTIKETDMKSLSSTLEYLKRQKLIAKDVDVISLVVK
jgi:sulfonate transport system substrate-binding protein